MTIHHARHTTEQPGLRLTCRGRVVVTAATVIATVLFGWFMPIGWWLS